jgi:hypothetical protein
MPFCRNWERRGQDHRAVLEPLAELFSSRVRAAVLAVVLPRPHLAFSLTDLSRRLGFSVSSVQHECYKLTRLGVLRDERAGNARLYRPNTDWPLLPPLTALVVRALPLDEALRAAVERVPGIDAAWLAGTAAGDREPAYLVVVGNLQIEEIDGVFDRARIALTPVAGVGGIELAYFQPADWASREANGDAFARSLVATRSVDLAVTAESPARTDMIGA